MSGVCPLLLFHWRPDVKKKKKKNTCSLVILNILPAVPAVSQRPPGAWMWTMYLLLHNGSRICTLLQHNYKNNFSLNKGFFNGEPKSRPWVPYCQKNPKNEWVNKVTKVFFLSHFNFFQLSGIKSWTCNCVLHARAQNFTCTICGVWGVA